MPSICGHHRILAVDMYLEIHSEINASTGEIHCLRHTRYDIGGSIAFESARPGGTGAIDVELVFVRLESRSSERSIVI